MKRKSWKVFFCMQNGLTYAEYVIAVTPQEAVKEVNKKYGDAISFVRVANWGSLKPFKEIV